MPDEIISSSKMNDTATTDGGYIGTLVWKDNLENVVFPIIQGSMPESKILEHRELLVNAVTNGVPSGGAWYNNKVILPTEYMVYGARQWSPGFNTSTTPYLYMLDKTQLAGFQINTSLITVNRNYYWLRDVVNSTRFAVSTGIGYSDAFTATYSLGIRPVFGLRG